MVSDLYVFDLETYQWEKLIPDPEDEVPKARYFHSADTCELFTSSLCALSIPTTSSREQPIDYIWRNEQ